jgi:23S rRNA (uracil1939-C5)-methyltransferase
LAEGVEVEPVVPAPNIDGYRNKMEFGFSTRRWLEPRELADPEASAVPEGGLALGLHARGFFGKVIDLESCAIHPAVFDDVVGSARRLAREHGLSAWDVKEHQGLLRHAALRAGARTGDLMLYLVTTTESPELVDPYVHALCAERPELTTVVQGITDRLSTVAVGDTERVLFGPGTIRERCLELDFEISPTSFFQTNTEQAERLFTMARDEAMSRPRDEAPLVWDLYCGTGSLTLALAADARRVVGFEQVPSAVADARRNAERNGIGNVEFVEGDVLELIGAVPVADRPDVMIVDPPRAGLHPKVPAHLAALRPESIVYVSCNPSSAARDVKELVALGYELTSIRPVDLFPHTPHVECVIGLERPLVEAEAR